MPETFSKKDLKHAAAFAEEPLARVTICVTPRFLISAAAALTFSLFFAKLFAKTPGCSKISLSIIDILFSPQNILYKKFAKNKTLFSPQRKKRLKNRYFLSKFLIPN
jgi:hypothetical protein